MYKIISVLCAGLLLTAAQGQAQSQGAAQSAGPDDPARAQIRPITAQKIILVGDSTVALRGGWGPAFCANHATQGLTCVNLARGGRSSFSFRAEGSWDLALKEMHTGGYTQTYVLFQFGHNDQPGKPGRSTDLKTEFPANMARYVEETRAAGAIPVLVTPLTRRIFRNGHLDDSLSPWAEAVRKVAADLHVPLVDLFARSSSAVQAMGAAKATEMAMAPPSHEVLAAAETGTTAGLKSQPNTSVQPDMAVAQDNAAVEPVGAPSGTFDYTHLGAKGAEYFANIVAYELAKAVPALRPDLYADRETSGPQIVSRLTPPPATEQKAAAIVRVAPYRYNDILWENDRTAHRIYAKALEAAEPPSGSGIDVWGKNVRYPFMERQLKTGDQHSYHGEGLDFYDVGSGRGMGGLGIWDDNQLWVSRNYQSAEILNPGPKEARFVVHYAPWPVGVNRKVWESRIFSLKTGTSFTRMISTISSDDPTPLIVGIGLNRHGTSTKSGRLFTDKERGVMIVWEETDAEKGTIGTALRIDPKMIVGFSQDAGNYLVLLKVTPGQPFVYYAGGVWDKGLDIHSAADWQKETTTLAVSFDPKP